MYVSLGPLSDGQTVVARLGFERASDGVVFREGHNSGSAVLARSSRDAHVDISMSAVTPPCPDGHSVKTLRDGPTHGRGFAWILSGAKPPPEVTCLSDLSLPAFPALHVEKRLTSKFF